MGSREAPGKTFIHWISKNVPISGLMIFRQKDQIFTTKTGAVSNFTRHEHISSIIDECFSLETTSRYLSKELLEEAKKKAKKAILIIISTAFLPCEIEM